MPMHDSTRDQILDAMAIDGWANQSDGNVESPTGYFSRISNDVADIVSIIDAFGGIGDVDFDFSELIGHFMVVRDSQGFLYVWQHASEETLKADYSTLVDEYSAWLGDDE